MSSGQPLSSPYHVNAALYNLGNASGTLPDIFMKEAGVKTADTGAVAPRSG